MNENTIGDGPIEKEYIEMMQMLAREIDKLFNHDLKGANRETGFILIVFPFGEKGRCNYISNAQTNDVIEMLRDQANGLENLK
jgi:hypothetical protein